LLAVVNPYKALLEKYYIPGIDFVKEIHIREQRRPDQIQLKDLHNSLKFYEFTTALFTLIAIFSGIFYYQIDILYKRDEVEILTYENIKFTKMLALVVINISNVLFAITTIFRYITIFIMKKLQNLYRKDVKFIETRNFYFLISEVLFAACQPYTFLSGIFNN
jgi:hypothetical protein